MPALLYLLIAIAGLLGGGTAFIGQLAPQAHAALMQQLSASGLVREETSAFTPGWLQARNQGELQLASSLCSGCDRMRYDGQVHQGLGALLAGDLAVLSLDYALELPDLPLEPPLPPLQLSARQRLTQLDAELSLPPSQNLYRGQAHAYVLSHEGLQGELESGLIQLRTPGLRVQRDESDWLSLTGLHLDAAADANFLLDASLAEATVPGWRWRFQDAVLHYSQQADKRELDCNLDIRIPRGTLGDQAPHGATQADLDIADLDLPSTLAFARELPGLMSPHTPRAARMFGLFSLYSIHGPAFFAAAPKMDLKALALPLPEGPADLDIALSITPGTRRPPMHPLEWRQALRGHIDIQAPRSRLATWWADSAELAGLVTGLPRRYSQLLEQGWVVPQADGRDRLAFTLDPARGPVPGTS